MKGRLIASTVLAALALVIPGCKEPVVRVDAEPETVASRSASGLPALPEAVSNNAVAWIESNGRVSLFSFMGIGPEKSWNDIRRHAFMLDSAASEWVRLPAVPGETGRIAATAAGVDETVYLFGGYEVASDGHEVSSPATNVLDVPSRTWSRGADIPVPVDDSVSGVYRGRYIYLVSGWSQTDNVDNVQVYDTREDTWMQATPIPGTPVFGHSGGLVGQVIVYCDGAHYNEPGETPRYVATDECWLGTIDGNDPAIIAWESIDPHPGAARYRSAAVGVEADRRIYFAGGTDNPYNINGVGYDGNPSEPVSLLFAWDLNQSSWVVVSETTETPTMDHRGLVPFDGGLARVGGMGAGQKVTAGVNVDERSPSRTTARYD